MSGQHQYDSQPEVAAIVTSMADAEQPFVRDTIESVLADPGIGQVVLCVDENNTWLSTVLGSLLTNSRLEVIRIPLVPLGAVRNQALKYVRLPWVAYCNGDDVWCQGYVWCEGWGQQPSTTTHQTVGEMQPESIQASQE